VPGNSCKSAASFSFDQHDSSLLVTVLETLQRLARRFRWSRRPSLWLSIAVGLTLGYFLLLAPGQLDRWLVPGILALAWCLLWYSFVSLFPDAVFRTPTDTEPNTAQSVTNGLRRFGYGLLSLCLAATAVGLLMMTSRLLNTWNYGGSLSLTTTASPTTPDSTLPHLHRSANGRVILSWVDAVEDPASADGAKHHLLKFAGLENGAWGEPKLVASGQDWFINWADFPSVIAIDNQHLAAHWLRRSGQDTYAYDVVISQSDNNGQTWQNPQLAHADKTASEHGFVSLYSLPSSVGSSRFGAVWLDGRNTLNPPPNNAMTLRAAEFSINQANQRREQDAQTDLLDLRVCDCCQTDVATLGETVIVAYRDRGDTEVRDISVTRKVNGDWQPSTVVARDGWRVNGCPVNGPAIAVLAQSRRAATANRVALAWYTEAAGPKVRLALSTNAAVSFDNPITVDEHQPIGRVDVELDDDGSAIVSWVRLAKGANRAQSDAAELCVRRVFPGGSMEPIRVVARTSAARASGFPQMVRDQDQLVFAWTKTTTQKASSGRLETQTTGVATATVPIRDI